MVAYERENRRGGGVHCKNKEINKEWELSFCIVAILRSVYFEPE